MNDEQFEESLQALEQAMWPSTAEKLRARDAAQREALARVEAKLAQAADLLLGVTNQPFINSNLVKAIDLFLAIHAQGVEVTGNSRGPAQAEQQEAPTCHDCNGDGVIPVMEKDHDGNWIEDRCRTCDGSGRRQEAKGAHGDDALRRDAFAAYVDMSCNSMVIDGAPCYYLPSERMEAFDRMFSIGDAQPAATQPAVPVAEHPVVKALLEVAAAAHLALEGTDSDGVDSTRDEADRESLEAAIEVIDRLPDDQPGFTMEPAAKAAWALRNLTAVRGAEHE